MEMSILTHDSKAHAESAAPPLAGPDKRAAFDHYWETRDLCSCDLRTRLRIAIVEAMLEGRKGRLLDVGCGRGTVAAHFAELGHNVTAVDISPLAIQWTERQHPLIKAAVLDLESEPLTGSFETILCLEVLQQVREPVEVLSKMRDALVPGGTLIVSLPNEFHVARRLSILLGRVTFGGIDDTHIKLYTPAEHRRLFRACGLKIVRSESQSIIPPRWRNGSLHHALNPSANRFPGLLALSTVYLLRPKR
jgi:2-polyprenyl-3-methyl-5-hydroxy-6-metoxy-1,4-benzoquinol methylase